MLKECYSRVKRWLKLQRGRVTDCHRPSNTWLAAFPRSSIGPTALALTLLLPVSSPNALAQFQCQRLGARSLADYELEFAVSAEGRSQLGSALVPLNDSYPAASKVWRALLQDVVLSGLNLPFQWQLVLVDDGSMNAFSLPDGEVVVDRGLASLLGKNHGLWAALLAHEIAHVSCRHWLMRHSYESKLQESPLNFGVELSGMDSRWRMAAFDQKMDLPNSLSKFSHELEFEADNEGLMLMARAGFHPDCELALHHLMEANFGEASSLAASVSTHPRWSSRDRNCQRAYRKAVEEFDHRWTAAESSPGGAPPIVVFLGEPRSSRREPFKVSFSLRCVNPGQELRSQLAVYEKATKNGVRRESIEFWEPTRCNTHDEKKMMTVILPVDRRADFEREGQIRILNSDGVVLERSGFFTIHAEKMNKQKSGLDALAYQYPSTRD